MQSFCRLRLRPPLYERRFWAWFIPIVGYLAMIFGASCSSSTARRVTPQLAAPPQFSSEQMAQQGRTVSRRLAPDPIRYDIPPATLAALTEEVAENMGWQEHSILYEEEGDRYTVVLSEGKTFGVQRRVMITPTGDGCEALILPTDEELAARMKERVYAYLAGRSSEDEEGSPQTKNFSQPFPQVWQAVKETLIDGGFSFKTLDNETGFIESEQVPLGKASSSWFGGTGRIGRIAHRPSMDYNYKSVQWRYRIRAKTLAANATEVTVAAVIEADPSRSTMEWLTRGTLDLLSVPFGSQISDVATGSHSSRVILLSRGKLEKEFFAGLARKLSDRPR